MTDQGRWCSIKTLDPYFRTLYFDQQNVLYEVHFMILVLNIECQEMQIMNNIKFTVFWKYFCWNHDSADCCFSWFSSVSLWMQWVVQGSYFTWTVICHCCYSAMHVAVRWKVYISVINEMAGTDKWSVSDKVMTCQPVGHCHYLCAVFIHDSYYI
jgi:hypothetical protein